VNSVSNVKNSESNLHVLQLMFLLFAYLKPPIIMLTPQSGWMPLSLCLQSYILGTMSSLSMTAFC